MVDNEIRKLYVTNTLPWDDLQRCVSKSADIKEQYKRHLCRLLGERLYNEDLVTFEEGVNEHGVFKITATLAVSVKGKDTEPPTAAERRSRIDEDQ